MPVILFQSQDNIISYKALTVPHQLIERASRGIEQYMQVIWHDDISKYLTILFAQVIKPVTYSIISIGNFKKWKPLITANSTEMYLVVGGIFGMG